MRSGVITCPGCGFATNLEVGGPICWKCERHFTGQDFADHDSRDDILQPVVLPHTARSSHVPNAATVGKVIGYGGACILVASLVLLLSWGSSGSEDPSTAKVIEANAAPSALEAATDQVALLSERFEQTNSTCEHGPVRIDRDGQLALAEVDLAMADNMDSISPSQEQRIRASIGSEMGLAPSQVDGWRSIYQGRAEQAKRLIAEAEEGEKRGRDLACTELSALKSSMSEASATLSRLKLAASTHQPR